MINSPRKIRSTERVCITCVYCKKIFDVKNYRKDIAKYCSRKCMALAARVVIVAKCEICKKPFEHICSRANKAKYCSRKCYYKAQSKKGRTVYKCQHCNKSFNAPLSTKRKFCSIKCVNKKNKATWNAAFTTVRKSMLSRGMIKACNRCGFSDHVNILGVHHIDHNRKNNDLSNLEVLCPNCHSIEHSKHINHAGNFD